MSSNSDPEDAQNASELLPRSISTDDGSLHVTTDAHLPNRVARWVARRAPRRIRNGRHLERRLRTLLPSEIRDAKIITPHRKLEHRAEWATKPVIEIDSPERRITHLHDVRVWTRNGVVEDASGRIVLDSAYEEYKLRIQAEKGALRRYPTDRIDVPVVVLATLWRPTNYYHWWIDYVCRAAAIAVCSDDFQDHVEILIDPSLTREQRSLLRAVLPSTFPLSPISRHRRVRASHLILLPRSSDFNAATVDPQVAARVRAAVESRYSLEPSASRKLIYVSREFATRRRFTNEMMLQDLLRRRGFSIVYLEQIPQRDQISMFREADTIVAQHGAGLTNLLFAQSGTRVLEIFSGREAHHYRWLAHAMQLDYSSVSSGKGDKNSDGPAPIDQILEWVDR